VRAGSLRNLISIQQKTVTVDSNGDRTEAWDSYHDAWASIETGNGREFFQAKQTWADLSHTITMRWKEGIKHEMRVLFEDPKTNTSRYFSIRAVLNPDERTEMMRLQCSEAIP
jgi:SPP1 family predicted phage head-tail adaptor